MPMMSSPRRPAHRYTALAVVVQAGGMSLVHVVNAQASGIWYIVPQVIGFALFLIAAQAELSQAPFDMPLADSELVVGPYTEYTGLRFALFLLAEYAGIVLLSALFAVMFLGGWRGPWSESLGPVWTLLKTGLVALVVIWLRVSWPRLREDQLQRFAWGVLVPVALAQLLVVSVIAAW